ncbi:MAG: hypothetical protein EB084_25565 [Proteobacteria bacterium]|nr:hypothetical protein [Pseudomonadota bacterium]
MLCDEKISRQISTCFVPLYLELNDGRKHPELELPGLHNNAGHAHFAYVLTRDGRVMNLRSPDGDELDNIVSFRRMFDNVIARLHLQRSDAVPERPFPPTPTAITLRVVSRYTLPNVLCRRQLDLDAADVKALLPADGHVTGSHIVSDAIARKLLVALRPVSTPHPQQIMQSEPDSEALNRLKLATFEATTAPADGGELVVALRGKLGMGPRPDLSTSGMRYGDPEGHINAAGADVRGYLRVNPTSGKVSAFDLVVSEGWYEYGTQSSRLTYKACARLSTTPSPR